MPQDARAPTQPSKSRRWRRYLAVAAAVIVIMPLLAPYVASSDFFRDRVLNAAVGDLLEVQSESASFGWWNPVTIEDLTLDSVEHGLQVEVAELRSDRAWWELWWSPYDLGHMDFIQPSARINLDWKNFGGYSAGDVPQFSAALRKASLSVDLQRMKQPVIDLEAFDLALRVERMNQGEYLVIDDAVVFHNRQITADACSQFLQLIDPTLGDVVRAEGQFTLQLDRLKLPLNVDLAESERHMSLAGTLELHQVTTAATTPLLKGIVRVAADMHNQPPSEIVRVVNQSVIDFEIRAGRLYHTGLRFGLPDIDPDLVIRAAGSVGLDETLDVHVSIPKLFLNEQPIDQPNQVEVAKLHITGTIAKPIVTRLDQPQESLEDEISLR